MFRITLTTIGIFMCFSSFAAKYDKAKIAQYLEEQSFNLVIEMGSVISADECDNYLYNAMGYSYYQLGLHTQSDAYYQLSIKLDSNNLQANLYLGILNKQKRNNEKSETNPAQFTNSNILRQIR